VAQTLARQLQDWQGEVLPGEWLDHRAGARLLPWARARRCGCSARASCWRCRSGRPPRPAAPGSWPAWRFAQGQSHKAIALELGLSPATVRTYLRDAYQRLGVDNRVALIHRLAALDGAAAS
jgi:hypothetical protein